MREKRLLSLMFASALGAMTVSAQTNMVVKLNNGTAQRIDISTVNKVLLGAKSLTVYADNVLPFDYTNVTSLKFEQTSDGINGIVGDGGITLDRNGDLLTLTGINPGDRVNVYNAKGQAIGNVVMADGLLNLSSLGKGVYVIQVNNTTFKISR